MNWLECGIIVLVALAATIALTPAAKALAVRFGAIDYPDQRRINTNPTPRMGGVALLGGIVASCIVLLIGVQFFGWIDPFQSLLGTEINYFLLVVGILIMFAVGFFDDIYSLRPATKFLGQVIAACVVTSSGLLLSNIQNPFDPGGFIEFGVFSYPITVFYLIAFANIINLIDGLDGLASGISAISAATIFIFSVLAGRYEAAVLSIIIVGICVGFLVFNHHPASIFLGDSGSLLLGLTLGIVSLFAVARSTLFISLLVPIMAAGVPVVDTTIAIIRRLRAHQPVNKADTGHIHHRLLSAGFSQGATVAIMWGWTAVLAICSLVLAESEGWPRIIAIIIAAVVTGIAIVRLHLLGSVLRHHYNPRTVRRGSEEDASDSDDADAADNLSTSNDAGEDPSDSK